MRVAKLTCSNSELVMQRELKERRQLVWLMVWVTRDEVMSAGVNGGAHRQPRTNAINSTMQAETECCYVNRM